MSTHLVSVPAVLESTARARPDHPAVVVADATLSYSQLSELTQEVAAALVASEVGQGDRVAIWAPNSPEWIASLLGLLAAGATLVPINTRFKGAEAAEVLRRSRARVLITTTDFLGVDYVQLLEEHRRVLPDLATVVVVEGAVTGDAVAWSDFLARAEDQDRETALRRTASVGPDDVSDILFTSGTTGVPKGVVMTHGRTLRIAADWVEMTGLNGDDRYLMVNPYFHMFGLKAGIIACVVAGAAMLPEPVFDVERVLATVEREAVTALPGPPTLFQSVLDHPRRDDFDLSSLRFAVTGAADIPVELIRRVREELPFSMIATGYGLTEAGTASGSSPDDDFEAIATTVGRPRPGYEIRIAGSSADDGAQGAPGEVLIRGASVMLGYLDDPEATAAALDDDGWLHTGDLGVLDGAGRLRIVGRSKDMYIVGGFNAYPAEIENALLRHPDVREAAVIGIPDERLGEVGMAFLVLHPGSSTTEAELIAWSREQMANFKVPRRVALLEALPVNATGKVLKDELRARAAAAPLS